MKKSKKEMNSRQPTSIFSGRKVWQSGKYNKKKRKQENGLSFGNSRIRCKTDSVRIQKRLEFWEPKKKTEKLSTKWTRMNCHWNYDSNTHTNKLVWLQQICVAAQHTRTFGWVCMHRVAAEVRIKQKTKKNRREEKRNAASIFKCFHNFCTKNFSN